MHGQPGMKNTKETENKNVAVHVLVTSLLTSGMLRLWHHADLSQTCQDRDQLFVANSHRDDTDRHIWAVRAQIQPWMWSDWWVPIAPAAILASWANTSSARDSIRTMLYIVTMVSIGLAGNWALLHGACSSSSSSGCKDARFQLAANNCNYPADERMGLETDTESCMVCDNVVHTMSVFGAITAALSVTAVVFS